MIRRIPYPVPAKREKPKSGIERAPQRIWPRHRRFVKSHCCCVPGCPALLVDPAHLRSVVFDGAGLTPFDWFLAPLCRLHHEEEEPIGPDAFGDRHGIDLWAIAAELARRSPDTGMRLAYLEWQTDQLDERGRGVTEKPTSPLTQQGAATPDKPQGWPVGNVAKPQEREEAAALSFHPAHRGVTSLTIAVIPLCGVVR